MSFNEAAACLSSGLGFLLMVVVCIKAQGKSEDGDVFFTFWFGGLMASAILWLIIVGIHGMFWGGAQ